MKTKLLLLLFLPSIMMAQITQGFEDVPGVTFNAVGDFCEYFDSDAVTVHTLANYTAGCGLIYVKEAGTASTVGYSIVLDPTTPNGPIGFTDTDFFGVANTTSFTSELGVAPPEGSQAFFMEDVDGTVIMSFDPVDLSGVTSPQFSMQYILEGTGWETLDFLRITIQFTDCASSALTLIDTTTGTGDINDLGIEDVWQTLNADLSTDVGCKAQLIVEFSSNSGAEELGLDDISFSGGVVLSNKDNLVFENLKVYPNPSNTGFVNIESNLNANKIIAIYDILGKMVKHETLTSNRLNIQDLTAGIYILKINQGTVSTTKKLIVN